MNGTTSSEMVKWINSFIYQLKYNRSILVLQILLFTGPFTSVDKKLWKKKKSHPIISHLLVFKFPPDSFGYSGNCLFFVVQKIWSSSSFNKKNQDNCLNIFFFTAYKYHFQLVSKKTLHFYFFMMCIQG